MPKYATPNTRLRFRQGAYRSQINIKFFHGSFPGRSFENSPKAGALGGGIFLKLFEKKSLKMEKVHEILSFLGKIFKISPFFLNLMVFWVGNACYFIPGS